MTTTPPRWHDAALLSAAYLDEFESQEVFRALLDAFSRPGRICTLPAASLAVLPSTLVPLLALLGFSTSFSVTGDDLQGSGALVSRVTSAVEVPISDATYVAVSGASLAEDIRRISVGSAARPESGAQVVVGLPGDLMQDCDHTNTDDNINVDDHLRMSMRGPGIDGVIDVCVSRPTRELFELLDRRTWVAPVGFDLWLVDRQGRIAGIPRSTQVQAARLFDTTEKAAI